MVEKMMEEDRPSAAAEGLEVDAATVKGVAELLEKVSAATLKRVLEELMAMERAQRVAANAAETAFICAAVVTACVKVGDWNALNANVVALSKRRAQLKQAVVKMVQAAMEQGLDFAPDMEAKVALIETLREVCSGKIYVELEEARLTRMIADIYEARGEVVKAADIMQDMQVETYGSMERREKTDFILEQVRLCLMKKDYVRAGIIVNKIMPRTLAHDDMFDLRLRYYALLAEIQAYNVDMLEICRCFLSRFESMSKQKQIADSKKNEDAAEADESSAMVTDKKGAEAKGNDTAVPTFDPALYNEAAQTQELRLVVIFLAFAEHGPMQSDLLHRVCGMRQVQDLNLLAEILKQFTTEEIVRWSTVEKLYKHEFEQAFGIFCSALINKDQVVTSKFKWEDVLRDRITEHNLRVLSKYYSRLRLDRMAELLDLSVDAAEQRLAAQVADKKALDAKIDRPKGTVTFKKQKVADASLNDWANSVSKVLELVENTCHLVNKEIVIKQAMGAAAEPSSSSDQQGRTESTSAMT
ncbi:26S proteasome non-ATPase regulatory subunit 12 [Porphyridium purpureum]|uniref:26S proteasome non-ATPase regulatory subunit 12 n=1 Tax=Porphyridium purpureum TaxID=35688 RepID=A0A5J4YK12_PORPP|nr:26S proteasome non-ATPase regulatory subunit 12 [Porphyridium purpureum]|eukprot:POR0932..scf244_11